MDTTESVTDNDIRQKQYLDALDGTESKLLAGYNIKQILFNECWYCIDVSSKSVFKALIRALLFNPCSINKKINDSDVLTFYTYNFRKDHDSYWQKILDDLGQHDEITIYGIRNKKDLLKHFSPIGLFKKMHWYHCFINELSCISARKDRRYLAVQLVLRKWMIEKLEKMHLNPKLVMCLFDSSPDENIVMQYFKKKGAITVTNQHGQPLFRSWEYDRMNQSQILNFKCDYYLCKGEFTREQFRKAGFNEDKVIPVGIVGKSKNQNMKRNTTKILGVYLDCPTFPFAAQCNTKIIRLAEDFCNISSYKYFIKLHPSDNIENATKGLTLNNCIEIYDKTASLESTFDKAEFAIINASATYLDAYFYGIRCFKLDLDVNYPIAYSKDVVSDAEDMLKKTKEWQEMSDIEKEDYINNVCRMYDSGWKAGKVNDVVNQMICNT